MAQLSFRFPERSLAWSQLRRGVGIWFVLRLLIGSVAEILPDQTHNGPFTISGGAAFGLIALVGVLGLLEARRLNEHRFSANLGIPIAFTVLWSVVPAMLLESLLPIIGLR